jgi:hypothetical protein
MNKMEKVDLALKLLMKENKPEITYAMMYGYLTAMVEEKTADAILELVKKSLAK